MNIEIGLVILSGLSIGLFGGFHCVGMCGPLALSLPIHHLSSIQKFLCISYYNLGRAIVYTFFGVLFGILGQAFSVFKLQQLLSIGGGIFIITVLIIDKFGVHGFSFFQRFTKFIKIKLGSFFKSDKSTISYLYIGVLNGLLPCGLVYVAIAASLATSSIFNSALLMLSFGFGTIPIMALTMIFGSFISIKFRNKLNRISPFVILFVAISLLLRGLNLGIPYVSPKLEKNKVDCCNKINIK